MLPNLTNQYISYSMAIFSANEIRTFIISFSESQGESAPNEKVDEGLNSAENCQAKSEIRY